MQVAINNNKNIEIRGNIRAREAADYLSIGLSTYWLWVKQGRIKKPIKFGSRISVWSAEYIRELAKNGIPENVGGLK